MVAKSPRRIRNFKRPGALQILEESVHLLRMNTAAFLSNYYIGSLPFALGFLYFWADMSRSAYAAERLPVAALGLGLLFAWMKFWHFIFCGRIRAYLHGTALTDSPFRSWASVVATQTLIQASGFIILPLAGMVVIPLGWCYAFYQNASVPSDQYAAGVGSVCKYAWQQARLWPRQNHIVILILTLFGIVVFINTAACVVIVPHLIKKLLSIETVFTLSGIHMINTTFWAVCFCLTYLFIDPLIKTAYTLRCYYGAAVKTGADLKADLRPFVRFGSRVAAAGIIGIMLISSTPVRADNQQPIETEALDRSIEEVLNRPEFAWRMPRDFKPPAEEIEKGPLMRIVEWLGDKLVIALKTVTGWIERLAEWLAGLIPENNSRSTSTTDWIKSARILIVLLLSVLLCLMLWILYKILQRRRPSPVELEAVAAEPDPDLTDENVHADELPLNRWLDLAKQLRQKGEWRLAMRALYLATLAYLAEKNKITIAAYKSNQDYLNEVYRRAHDNKDLLAAFTDSVNRFERVWYGMRKMSRSDYKRYQSVQKRIMTFA